MNAVHENDSLTQRSIASDLGIALGLANAYLKRCVKKGYVKVSQIPKNRYAYYLTPKGFAEKSRLTAEYLSQSFNFFRSARAQCEEAFSLCEKNGWRRVALVGQGDFYEIAGLCAREYSVSLVGGAIDKADAALIVDLSDPQAAFDAAIKVLPRECVLAPRLLKVSQRPPQSPPKLEAQG